MEGLRNWNEKAPLMPQIAPNFGLYRDYDEFLLGTAPGLLASIAAIFGHNYEGRAYLSELVENILKAIPNAQPHLSFYNAVWLLHMAAPLPDRAAFDTARNFINDRGGISGRCLLCPPFQIPASGACFPEEFPWNLDIAKNPEAVPDHPKFRDLVTNASLVQPSTDAHLSLAIKLLTEQGNLDPLVPLAVSLLSYMKPPLEG
jgi:hypothetical protein